MFSPEELKRILQESDVIKNVSIIKEAKLFENVYQTVLQGELVIKRIVCCIYSSSGKMV